jgi:hypothetical protein
MFVLFAFPSLDRQIRCFALLSLLVLRNLTSIIVVCLYLETEEVSCYFFRILFLLLFNMDHSMHMGMGHGDMGHGDMDMGGKCNMNVRYTLHICFDLMLISNI